MSDIRCFWKFTEIEPVDTYLMQFGVRISTKFRLHRNRPGLLLSSQIWEDVLPNQFGRTFGRTFWEDGRTFGRTFWEDIFICRNDVMTLNEIQVHINVPV